MFINTEYFREAALQFKKNGYYTNAPAGTKDWEDFWDIHRKRSLEGYSVGGVKITGHHYWYLNFSRMMRLPLNSFIGDTTEAGKKVEDFPAFIDWDYNYFWAVDIARNGIEQQAYNDLNLDVNILDLSGNKHLAVIKARRKGYSYKSASMLARNYHLMRKSKGFALAGEKEFLDPDKDGLLAKTWMQINFIDNYTAFRQPRITDRKYEKVSGYKRNIAGTDVNRGLQSVISGVTLKDDPNKARGKDGDLIFFEEAGKLPGLLTAWKVCRPSVEDGIYTTGQMIAFGCLTGNNRVWNNKGELVKIKDINIEDGILGYSPKIGFSKEEITYLQEPKEKPCLKITTNTGRSIECSMDHPILWSNQGYGTTKELPKTNNKRNRKFSKRSKFKIAEEIKVGDQVATIEEVDIWSNKEMWEPRLTGLLVGDGSYGFNKTPILSNCDKEINDFVYNNYDAIKESGYITKDGREYKETRIRGICKHLRDLKIYGQTGKNKRLPENIHGYRKKDVIEFLSGLFDADGYYCARKYPSITLASCSKNLLLDVLLLLQKLGVHGSIDTIKPHKSSPKSKNNYYRLEIKDKKSVQVFCSFIKPLPEYKKQSRDKILNLLNYRTSELSKSKYVKGVRFERVTKIEHLGWQPVYNLTANKTHTYIGEGIITHNTGGEEGADFEGLNELVYNPEAYNVLPIENQWDEGGLGTQACFFVPAYCGYPGYIDKDGNSDKDGAKAYEQEQREKTKKAPNPSALSQHISEYPFTIMEATIQTSQNIFPIAELQAHLNNIKVRGLDRYGIAGNLYYGEKGLDFTSSPSAKPITQFPHSKNQDLTGSVVIYQTPYKDKNGQVPNNLYIGIHDPYAHDQSIDSTSLGAFYVMKRENRVDRSFSDSIVAAYVGRPRTQDEYNRIMFMLAEYYNCKIAFENDRGNVIEYAKRFKLLGQLQEEFDVITNTEKDTRPKSKVRRKFGIHMTTSRKEQAEVYVRDWLIQKRGTDEDGNVKLTLHNIFDVPLLQELIKFNKKGNFDRVSALFVGMYYLKELHSRKVTEEVESPYEDFFLQQEHFI